MPSSPDLAQQRWEHPIDQIVSRLRYTADRIEQGCQTPRPGEYVATAQDVIDEITNLITNLHLGALVSTASGCDKAAKAGDE